MNPFKAVWGLLFRLFPCPVPVGLRRVGRPTRDSPVLVTCNFYTTVARLTRALRRAGVDAWLLVADSKGVNVWCAAGGDEFNTHAVVSALKTSGIAEQVDHRTLILPPLGGPGIRARDVREQTGWKPRFGPVSFHDLPRYLASGHERDEQMKRARYGLRERLDTALGSMFPFYLAGVLGFLVFGRSLLVSYLLVGALSFLLFYSLVPWLPTRHGLTKALPLELLAGGALAVSYASWGAPLAPFRAELIIGMAQLLVFSSELGGLASTLPSDLDPFLARLGVGALGNVAFSGMVRTELLNGYRVLTLHADRCIGCRDCAEICPLGVWEMGPDKRSSLAHPERCTACRACLQQCPSGAIEARDVRTPRSSR